MMASSSSLQSVLVLLLGFTLVIAPVWGLSVEGAKIMMDVTPGQNYSVPMGISIGENESPVNLTVDVAGFGQSTDGTYHGFGSNGDTGPFTARPYLTVDTPSFRLAPGGRENLTITIRVPASVGDGGRYALILVHSAEPAGSGGQPGISEAIQVPVMLTLAGTNLIETGSIASISADQPVPGGPVEILTTVRNTGNHHYYGMLVNVTISDPSGEVVASASTDPSIFALIPGNEMTLTTPVSGTLKPGMYSVRDEARRADGMALLDAKTGTLLIRAGEEPVVTGVVPAGTGTPPGGIHPEIPWPDAASTVIGISAVILTSQKRRG
jgi:hypothetical protein